VSTLVDLHTPGFQGRGHFGDFIFEGLGSFQQFGQVLRVPDLHFLDLTAKFNRRLPKFLDGFFRFLDLVDLAFRHEIYVLNVILFGVVWMTSSAEVHAARTRTKWRGGTASPAQIEENAARIV
jgi:hypothetical protein